jgi:hypothetical protein
MYIDFVGVKPEMFISGLGGLIFMTCSVEKPHLVAKCACQ